MKSGNYGRKGKGSGKGRMLATFMVQNTYAAFLVRPSYPSPITHHPDFTNTPTTTVSLPELIAHTNMDHQSVSKLRDEMAKLTQWLGKNSNRFFTAEYETASQEYVEKSKGAN